MFERFKKSGLPVDWTFAPVSRLNRSQSLGARLNSATTLKPAGRIALEVMEQRVLLSADINPAFGALATDPDQDPIAAIHEVGQTYTTVSEDAEVDLNATAIPSGGAPELSSFDLTVVDEAGDTPGSRVLSSTEFLTIDETAPQSSFTLDLQGGQVLSLYATSGDAVEFNLTLTGPDDVDIASGSGDEVLLNMQAVTDPGVYTVTADWTSGGGQISVTTVLNGAIEAEAVGGAANNRLETAQSIDGSRILSQGGASQVSVIGSDQSNGSDFYSFDVTPGEVVSIWATSRSGFSLGEMRVYSDDGSAIAAGEYVLSFDGDIRSIRNMVVRDDVDRIIVEVTSYDDYNLFAGMGLLPAQQFSEFNGPDITLAGLGQGFIAEGGGFGGGGEFEVSSDVPLTPLSVEPDNTLNTANPVFFGPSRFEYAYETGEISNTGGVGDRDVYQMFAEEGDYLDFYAYADFESSFEPFIQVFDQFGTLVATGKSFESDYTELFMYVETTGFYYLVVSGAGNEDYDPTDAASGSEGAQGAYSVDFYLERANPVYPTSYFNIDVVDGDEITLTTFTPDDVQGLPGEMPDPVIEFSSTSAHGGTLVETDSGDGRNASYTFVAQYTGNVSFAVYSEDGAGTVQVAASGSSAGVRDLDYFGTSLGENGTTRSIGDTVLVYFDRQLYGGDVNAADFLINGVTANSASYSPGSTRASFDIAGLVDEDGTYNIEILGNSLTALDGGTFGGASFTVTLDTVGPELTSSIPANGGVVDPGLESIVLNFSENLRTSSFSPFYFTLTNQSTGEVIPVASSTTQDLRQITLDLAAPLGDGAYSLTLDTSYFGFQDAAGNPVQTSSIGFAVDSADIAIGDLLQRVGAPGLGAFEGTIDGNLYNADDVDTFTFSLAQGQAVSFALSNLGSADAGVSLVDADGTVVWTGTSTPDQGAVYQSGSEGLAAGDYEIQVSGVDEATDFSLLFGVNTVFEQETVDGTSNDAVADAEAPVFLRTVGQGETVTVSGALAASDGDAADHFAVTLTAGDRLDVVGGATAGTIQLALLDSTGEVITLGSDAFVDGQAIGNFVAPEDGVYIVRVASTDDAAAYQLGLVTGIALQTTTEGRSFDINGLDEMLGGLGGGLRYGSGGRIAVLGVSSYASSFQKVVDQLNDSTVFNFDASLVYGVDLDTADELNQYDVVIMSNTGSGRSVDAFSSVASLLPDWVNNGGAAIMTGWGVYGSGDETTATRNALAEVLPVFANGSYSFVRNSTNVINATHPVTDGLSTITGTIFEYPRSGLTEGAIALGGSQSNPTIAVREVGLGRSVYLGGIYASNSYSGFDTGETDQLLEQAVAWAGGSALLGQLTFDAVAGQEITLETSTPADDVGLPNNAGDLTIRLYSADGELLAENADGASDGRNALLTFTVPDGGNGQYFVEIISEQGGAAIDYVLSIDGLAQDVQPKMTVIDTLPEDGTPISIDTDWIDVNFSQAVNVATLDASDLTVDGDVTVDAVELIDGDTARFFLSFPDGDATYTWSMEADAVSSIAGVGVEAETGTFIRDLTAPWVDGTLPAATAGAPFNSLTFVFNEAIDPDSLSIEDITEFTRPDGVNIFSNILSIDVDGAEITVAFSDQFQAGRYTMTLGPDVTDLSGNAMTSPDGTETSFQASIDIESPDLEVSSLIVPDDVEFGVAFNVTFTITNTGSDPASSSPDTRLYLGNASGTTLRSLVTVARPATDDSGNALPPLQPGASYTQTVSLTLPITDDRQEGAYSIVAIADIYSEQNESDETNNRSFAAVEVTYPPVTDLVVEAFDIPTGAISGQTLPLSWTITNTGDADFNGSFSDRVYLSSNGTSLTSLLGTFGFSGPIAAGESVTRVENVTLPDTLEGEYFIRILTDYFDQIAEGSDGEQNNRTSSNQRVDITLRDFPNLVVTDVQTPDQAFSSGPITVEWTVENIGLSATNAPIWYDLVYLSLDDVAGNDDDIYLGRATNPSFLDVDGSYRNSLTATLPRGIEGPYYITVRADGYDAVEEFTDEGDNAGVSDAFAIALTPPPDLQVTNVISPTQAFSGNTTQLTYTVTNAGDGRTLEAAWYDEIWLSEDEVIDADDFYLGRHYHTGRLEAGASYDTTLSVRLPVGEFGDRLFLVNTDSDNNVFEFVYENNNIGFDKTDEGAPDFTPITLTPPPDLEIVVLEQPDPFYSGRTQLVSYEVANIGATSTLNLYRQDQVWLSDNDVLDATDVLVGQRTHYGQLASGEFEEYSMTVTLPNGTLGDRTLLFVTDAENREFELNKDNNVAVSAVDATILAADLAVTSFDAPLDGEAGEAITVSWTVENSGEGDSVSGSWNDQLIISTDDVLGNSDDRVIANFGNVGLLAADASYEETGAVVQLPFDLEGAYFLFMKTDSGNAVFENGRSGNNVSAAQPITITRNVADLAAQDVTFSGPDESAPNEITAGRNLSVGYTVVNNGPGRTEATAWYDGVYLSLDDTLDTSEDVFVGRVYHVNRLGVGESYTAEVDVFVPVALQAGNYKVIIRSDMDASVTEEDAEQGNNIAVSDQTLAVAAFDNGVIDQPTDGTDPFASLTPDLVVDAVSATKSGFAGQSITVDWTVRNDGPQVTGNRQWYDTVYLSLDRNLDTGSDIRLGYVYHSGGLEVGETYDVSRSFDVPAGLAGDWFVFVRTDAGTAISEIDETNNNGVTDGATTLVLPAPTDLVADSVSVPETGTLGAPVTFTYSVRNESGNTVEGRWQDSFYLSADDAWDIDDALITTQTVTGPVAAGGTYTRTVTATLPGVVPGDYKIIVRSDIRNVVPESDESNNEGASDETVATDAAVLELDTEVSGTLAGGQAIFFKINLPEDETIRVSLDRDGTGASELFASFGEVPSRSDFDVSARDPFATDQIMTIPSSQPGEYYIMVFGQSGAASNFTLVAETVPFGLDQIDPTAVGNSAPATVRIEGARFSVDTQFQLKDADGNLLDAFDIEIIDTTLAFARFDVVGEDEGAYTLVASRGDLVVEQTDALFVVPELGLGSMRVNITGPDRVRPDRVNSFQVNFANTGGADTRAPLILVTSSADLAMGASGDSLARGGLQLLGSDVDGGPIDVFRPGAESSISVVYRTESAADGVGMNARAITERNIEQIENFEAIENQIRPDDISDEDWEEFWTRIQPRIGVTWGEYVTFVNDAAAYVKETTGESSRDVRSLFGLLYAANPDYLPSVEFSGAIVDDTGAGVGGVSLLAYEGTDFGIVLRTTVVTEDDGSFTLTGLKAGTYQLGLAGEIGADGVPGLPTYGFDINEDGQIDQTAVFAEIPEDQDVSGIQLRVLPLPEDSADDRARDPIITSDSSGRLHMTWSQDGVMLHAFNDGAGWSEAVSINGAEAFRDVKLVTRPGDEPGVDEVIVAWTDGEDGVSEIRYAVGRLSGDGTYVWSEVATVGQEAVAYGPTAAATALDGEVALLFTKRNTADEKADADIYAKTLNDEDLNLVSEVEIELEVEDTVAFVAFLETLSDEELDALAIARYRGGWNTPVGQFRADGTLRYDDKEASLAVSGALRGKLSLGKIKFEVEGRIGGEFGWYVNEDTCSWEYDWGKMNWRIGGAVNVPLTSAPIPVVKVIGNVLYYAGVEPSFRGEIAGGGSNLKYTSWGQFPLSPVSGKGFVQGSLGLDLKISPFFLRYDLLIRGLLNVKGDVDGWSVSPGNPFLSGSLLIRKEFQNGTIRDTTFSIPSGTTTLSLGDTAFQSYTIIDTLTGEVTVQEPFNFDEGDVEETISFGNGVEGTLEDLSVEGQTAVTNNLVEEWAPVIATSATGELTGIWVANEGIIETEYDAGSNTWSEGILAIEAGDYELSSVTVSYDGDGDKLLMWNELDTSGLFDGMSVEDFDAIQTQGGALAFSVYDDATGTWSAKTVLHDLDGSESALSTKLLANGDVLATWTYAVSEEAETGNVYAAIWDADTNTWSTPELVTATASIALPKAGQLDGKPVIIWTQDAVVAYSQEVGSILRMATLVDGAWVVEDVDVTLPADEPLDASSTELFTESVWNIESVLPEPDQEDCECDPNDPDCDDDDDDDYDPPVQRPSDPNDILGPEGFGEENWVSTEDPYSFKIRFENEPTATAPAQVVVITQEFDTDLNINSFRVDDFGWGDLIFEVDATLPFFSQRYDFTEDLGFFVDVFAGIDVTTGIATWTISTIDPETGEPPLDADTGFLPINDDTGIGEGFVTYTIAAGRRVESGTRVDSEARIVFDTEAPIDTPPIFHTLDAVAPTSEVDELPDRQDETDVVVSWTSADDEDGSGIGGVSVFVSTNGGDYDLWLDNTDLSQATWEGEAGNTYSFYSVAMDNSGWMEAAPETADATIAVGAQPGSISGVAFEDLDGDGVVDQGEGAFANVVVFIDLDGNGTLDGLEPAVLTDELGGYAFDGLQPGSYDVGLVLPDGLIRTSPGEDITAVTVVTEENSDGPSFGLFEPGIVSGVVYADGTGPQDGTRDGTEPGLAGWTVYIDADGSGTLDADERSTSTDAQGRYSFDALMAGPIDIRVVSQDNYDPTAPADGLIEVTVTSGLTATGTDFGFKPQDATISGNKFEDLDGDGVRDEGEGGLEGWTIYIDANGNGVLDQGEVSTQTDADGNYTITGLAPGTYIVAEDPQDGWVQTFPGSEPFVVNGTVVSTSSVLVELNLPTESLITYVDPLTSSSADLANELTGLDDFRNTPDFADVTGARTTVVTIDSGIDLDHGFFGPDSDGDGVSDRIVFSYDFADGDSNANDVTGHGTGVAGIIAGADGTYGGIAPDADLISLKVFSDSGAGYFSHLEQALQWVVLNGESFGVSVVNLSLGDGGNWGEEISRYGLGDELAALASQDVIVIAASGNSYASFDTQGVAYPAADPSVIGVGAVWAGDYGGPWYFSNGATDYTTGADRITAFTQRDDNLLDVVAPGARFVTAGTDGGLATVQGTSHAAAYMSGVATLAQDLALREFGHRLSAAEFSALLSQTAIFVTDGDDEQDSVRNTGLEFPRVDMVALAAAIMNFVPGSLDEGDTGTTDGTGEDTELVAAAGQYAVTVSAGETESDIDFGSFEQVTLSGVVFDDLDTDGQLGSGEAGVEGIVVYLDANEDGVLSDGEVRTTTHADGAWSFVDIGPGPETIGFVTPDGISATSSAVTVTTVSGTDVADINFGLDLPLANLRVSEVTTTRDGFEVRFNDVIDTSQISTNGELADVVLRNAADEIVRGSLVFDDDEQGFRFIASSGPLADEDYVLSLKSGADGFTGALGDLDGDANGVAGGDFSAAVVGSPTDGALLAMSNVVRAPGQSLAQGSIAPGIPLSLSGAAGLTEIEFSLAYDPAIFVDADLVAGAGLPFGAVLTPIDSVLGELRFRLSLSSPLVGEEVLLGYLVGTVSADATAGSTHLLDLTVIDAQNDAGAMTVGAVDGLHILALPGDMDQDGAYTLADVDAVTDLAFGGGLPDGSDGTFDVALLGDMDGDQDVDLVDSMLAFRASVGVFDPSVPRLRQDDISGGVDLGSGFGDFDLGNDSGSSVTAPDPFSADPFASDPFASDPSAAAEPADTSDPFASLSSGFGATNPFGAVPALPDTSDQPETVASNSDPFASAFGAFPPFPS